MKLFTIGDSISQGFMSGAAARTDQSYSTLLANIFKLDNYHFPSWPKGGHPLNLELLFRKLEKRLGADISGLIEWPMAFSIISAFLDEVEDYYERGNGSHLMSPQEKFFNNVSVRGFDLAASWMIKPSLCRDHIESSKNKGDNVLGMVDQSFFRTALTVLEAGAEKAGLKDPSQLDWLQYHHTNEGVENLILFLGANNALGTVTSLHINQTSEDGSAFKDENNKDIAPDKISYQKRSGWNLWHPEDFKAEYNFMFNKVLKIMESNPAIDYKVFIPTVPLVTIVPLTKSVGGPEEREMVKANEWRVKLGNPAPMGKAEFSKPEMHPYSYGKYYPYFLYAENFDISMPHLNMMQTIHIDNTIRQYNKIIIETVALANATLGKKRFYLVDISSCLSDMALKRNNYSPCYKYPSYFDFVYPRVDTRFYGTTRKGKVMAGGLFSLDGVHPTAIGQGLLAWEILKVMKQAGSFKGNPDHVIDWKALFATDSLRSEPISLMSELYDNMELKKWVLKMLVK